MRGAGAVYAYKSVDPSLPLQSHWLNLNYNYEVNLAEEASAVDSPTDPVS